LGKRGLKGDDTGRNYRARWRKQEGKVPDQKKKKKSRIRGYNEGKKDLPRKGTFFKERVRSILLAGFEEREPLAEGEGGQGPQSVIDNRPAQR